jgi:uncharacterized protein (TIGR02466 family)
MNKQRHLIFPTPIVQMDNPNVDIKEHQILIDSEYHNPEDQMSYMHDNFLTSKDHYILNQVPKLKKWIHEEVNNYINENFATLEELIFTQSWCLKHNDKYQKLAAHSHPNSIISGSYYVDAEEGAENLSFRKDYQSSSAPYIRWNVSPELLVGQPHAWAWYKIPVKTGRLILFPSQIMHEVVPEQITEHNRSRCVLAFNTWFKEPIGSSELLTRLEVL